MPPATEFQFTSEIKRRAGGWDSPYYELRLIIEVTLTIGCIILACLIYSYLVLGSPQQDISFEDVTNNWQDRPIVDFRALTPNEFNCPLAYERLSLDDARIKGIIGSTCSCMENSFGFHSNLAECSETAIKNGCSNTMFGSDLVTHSWRRTTFCVLRSNDAISASWRVDDAKSTTSKTDRPYPDESGTCPVGYRRCGHRRQYSEGAICFPSDTQCPITNIQVVASGKPPRSVDGWQSAGSLQNGSYELYVRREGQGELPIVDITVSMTERLFPDNEVRGPCLPNQGAAAQAFSSFLLTDPVHPWTYKAHFLPRCNRSDLRYEKMDQIPLEEHFLQQLQIYEPSCAAFEVLSRRDPAYIPSRDPDYLNSGVECVTPTCLVNQKTTVSCEFGDIICDAAVHQSMCGAFARAIRSALSDTPVALGLYFRRETEWRTSTCAVSRRRVSHARHLFDNAFYCLCVGLMFTLVFSFVMNVVVVILSLYYQPGVGVRLHEQTECKYVECNFLWRLPSMICYLCTRYFYHRFFIVLSAVHDGGCTDAFTQSTFPYTPSLINCELLLNLLALVEFALWAVAIVRIVNLVFIAEKIKSEEAISTATGTATVTATAVRATTTGSASSYPTGTATRAVLVPHHATALPPQPQGARHTALICRRLGTEGVSYEALRADDPDTDTDAQDRAAATATEAEGGVELQTFDSAV